MLRPRFFLLRRCITVQYGILQYSAPYRIVHHNHHGLYSYNSSSAHSPRSGIRKNAPCPPRRSSSTPTQYDDLSATYPSPSLTPQGIDDILAILLALSSTEQEAEIPLVSLTFGNIEVRRWVCLHVFLPVVSADRLHSCLRNVVSMFHILEREMLWRQQNGRDQGFGALRACRPVIAVGAEDPLENQKALADYFRMYILILPGYTVLC